MFSLSVLCWASTASAGVGSDLANFWDRAGGGVNYTKPQSYQGQRAGFATGGSLYIRTKQTQCTACQHSASLDPRRLRWY